jgi:hypothetical protein
MASATALATASDVAAPAGTAVCAIFADGTWDKLTDVIVGNLRNLVPGEEYTNLAKPLRDATRGLEADGMAASGEQRDDMIRMANPLDDAALSADYDRVIDLTDPFYVKYAEQCGQELAD